MTRLKRLLLLSSCICSMSTGFAASVVVYNDSPFPLTAEIYSADGKKMGDVAVLPQHQSSWQDPSPANTNYSQTPYTVILNCKSGGQYGIVSGVNSGAWVTASQAQGDRFCKTPKGQQQGQSPTEGQGQNQPAPGQQDFKLNPP